MAAIARWLKARPRRLGRHNLQFKHSIQSRFSSPSIKTTTGMMPSSPDFAQKSSPGSPLHFCVSLLPNGQPERSALFPLFHVVPRGGGENADRAPEMDIQAFRTHSAIEWPDWQLLCLNSWFPDVFMVFGHTVKAVGKPLKRPKTPKESTLQPVWPLSWRKTRSSNKKAILRGKFQNSFSGKWVGLLDPQMK